MLTIYKYPGDHIHIGLRGEHNARQVCFDITAWQELYGTEGAVELIYQRPGDSAPFPVAIEREGSTVTWIITNTDTEKDGIGCAELRYYIGDTLAKSASSAIEISVSMGEPGESPDPPGQSWLDHVLEAAKMSGGGVYVGSGEMPEGYNVQIDPSGAADVAATREWVNNHVKEAIQNGADPAGTAKHKIGEHNTSTTAHNDIRLIIDGLSNQLNALVNSTDNNLDKIAELVEYINANEDVIEGITTNKVNVSDIINNLTTNVANKPLSAAQGVAIKAMIDAIAIPTKLSQLTNDTGYLTQHQSLSGYAKTSDIKKWTLAQIQAAIDATWGAIY